MKVLDLASLACQQLHDGPTDGLNPARVSDFTFANDRHTRFDRPTATRGRHNIRRDPVMNGACLVLISFLAAATRESSILSANFRAPRPAACQPRRKPLPSMVYWLRKEGS